MSSATRRPPATTEDFLRRPFDDRVELIRGTIVEKPLASSDHSLAQVATSASLRNLFQRRPGGRYPGGWWSFTELLVQLGQDIVRPDICGYRRERMAEPSTAPVVKLAPDWICELISPTHEVRDRVDKMHIYLAASVPHYWLMNPALRILEVYRRTDIGYALILTAQRGDRVRAEPFDAVELRVDELFGDDPEDEPA